MFSHRLLNPAKLIAVALVLSTLTATGAEKRQASPAPATEQVQQCEKKILSINNSLIYYNDQPQIFNEMAAAMGKSAKWTARTQGGKTLVYHYNNTMSRNIAATPHWDYIVLQEMSSLPLDYPAVFYDSVVLWVNAVTNEGHTQFIVPMNWPYNDNYNKYAANGKILLRSYRHVEREIANAIVCPVGLAYLQIFQDLGQEQTDRLYVDKKHPSLMASYLAAVMEYALIFSEDPLSVTYVPEGITDEDAALMRKYAASAIVEWRKYMATK